MKKWFCVPTLLALCVVATCSCGKKGDECDHFYLHYEAKEPSFYEDGNIEYYICEKCSKTFDKSKKEINPADVKRRLEIFNVLDTDKPISLFGTHLDLTFDYSEVEKIINSSNQLIEKINKKNYTAVEANKCVIEINDMLKFLQGQYDIASLIADISAKSEDYQKANQIYNAYYQMQDQYYGVYVAIAKEGSYNHLFFKSYTEEEIKKFIINHSPSEGGGTGRTTTVKKIENLLNDYKAGKIEDFTALTNCVELSNQLATEKSYDNFLSYAYKNFGREYSVIDAINLGNEIVANITPLFSTISNKYDNATSDQQLSSEVIKLRNDFFGKNMDFLRDYAKTMGNEYKENFRKFFMEGRYYFSDIDNPNTTGYTANYLTKGNLIFLSKNYQSMLVFTHEFGHFNANEVFGTGVSLDLNETHSKTNELMLVSFMRNCTNFSKELINGFLLNTLYYAINEVLLDFAVNELENFIYTNTFTEETLKNKWTELLDKYGAKLFRDKFDYMYKVLMNYRGYYISYGTAGLAALQLFSKSLENFSNASDSYRSLYTKDSDDEKFKKSLQNAGLFDVFSNDSFNLISKISNI